MLDAIDSFYIQLKMQMALLNPAQTFGGIVQAKDWPQVPVVDSTLYLLVLDPRPSMDDLSSRSQSMYQYPVQWVWLVMGTDIQDGQQAANRGDRYRADMTIKQNLRQAHYPQFCLKQSYTADAQGNLTATPVASVIPPSSPEYVWWSRPSFVPKQDQKSGLIYGAAALSLYAYEDVDAAVAA